MLPFKKLNYTNLYTYLFKKVIFSTLLTLEYSAKLPYDFVGLDHNKKKN